MTARRKQRPNSHGTDRKEKAREMEALMREGIRKEAEARKLSGYRRGYHAFQQRRVDEVIGQAIILLQGSAD